MRKVKLSALLPVLLFCNTLQAEPKRYQVELVFWDDTIFYGQFDYDTASQQITNLQGRLDDTLMGNIEPIRYQLEATPDGQGGISASAYTMNTTTIATNPSINSNVYVTINFNAQNPLLGATDESKLAYMDCSAGGLMGNTCMYHLSWHDPVFPMSGGQGVLSETITLVDEGEGLSHSDCLFNWAENNYAELFSPALGTSNSRTLPPYYFRFYAATNAYLGISATDNHVYYLSPDNILENVGHSYEWIKQANCN